MPEIGEVARVVHFLRKYIKNRSIANVLTTDDLLVFNTKVGTDPAKFAAALKGKKVRDVRQQGKYFWLIMQSPPHPLMHLGMNGWMRIHQPNNEDGEQQKDDVASTEEGEGRPVAGKGKGKWARKYRDDSWPPRYWKFMLQFKGKPDIEVAFTDSRRLGRIRLVDCPASQMRKTTPLKENGPDPVQDPDILTVDWLKSKMKSKKVPIKALLLDQRSISGVGNWVADEVLYGARIHPEQYSNTFDNVQMERLHASLMFVCGLACQSLADPSQFPKTWLYKHRWGKGRKLEKNKVLPNGERYIHVTVAGRTSAIVPTVQKITGPVTDEVLLDEAKPERSSVEHDSELDIRKQRPNETTTTIPKKRKSRANSE